MNLQISKTILIAIMTLTLTSMASAKPGNGKGGGGKGGGGSGDGDSNETTGVIITFRDALDDRIGSDLVVSYMDGVDGVQAFIGSQANKGNVMLWLSNSSRGLYLDFSSCYDGNCTSPFSPYDNAINSPAAIKLNANDVLTNGVTSMAVGDTISAPLRVYYDLEDGQGPGFIELNPGVKGGSPCKNKSNFATVVRTSETSWDISSEPGNRVCASLPGGRKLSGVYLMPFSFTVEIP